MDPVRGVPAFHGGREVGPPDSTTRHLEWTAEIAGVASARGGRDHRAEPDQRIAWRPTSGAENAGVVTFQPLGDSRTRVTLQLDVEPEDPIETAGDALGFVERQAKGDLGRFKEFIEERGVATGGWRGDGRQGDVRRLGRA